MQEELSIGPDGNEEQCRVCSQSGSLVLCDHCPGAWHVQCLVKKWPKAARGVLDDAKSWYCPECKLNGDLGSPVTPAGNAEPFVGRMSRSDSSSAAGYEGYGKRKLNEFSLDGRRRVFRSDDGCFVLTARDDERPKDIARALGIDAAHLVKVNKRHLHGLRTDSKLHAGTHFRVPESTVRNAPELFCVTEKLRDGARAKSGASVVRKRLVPAPCVASGREDESVFTAEKIIGRRTKPRGVVEYLVKWSGFPEEHASWEPRKNILCDDLIETFETERRESEERSYSGCTYECVLKKQKSRDGESPCGEVFGFHLIGITDTATAQCWCTVVNSSGGNLPGGLCVGDVLLEVDGACVLHQPYERTLALLHSKSGARFLFEKGSLAPGAGDP